MKWDKYTLTTRTDAVDILSACLPEAGIEGIEVEDNIPLSEEDTKGMFIDILPDLPKDDGSAKISFYLEQDKSQEVLVNVKELLADLSKNLELGSCEIIKSETEDKDWINNWKEFFKPFMLDDILIKPTWEEAKDFTNYKISIDIDPGTAFGTGSHETTRLCIRGLNKYISKFLEEGKKELKILDVGTGSGILSIAALKLGASKVVATEIDEYALPTVKSNMFINKIEKSAYKLISGDILEDEALQKEVGFGCYDILVANILAPVIIRLQAEAARYLKSGGIFISSGIIDIKEKEVVDSIKANPELEIIDIVHDGEWLSVCARRK